jgi:hypothetical protein
MFSVLSGFKCASVLIRTKSFIHDILVAFDEKPGSTTVLGTSDFYFAADPSGAAFRINMVVGGLEFRLAHWLAIAGIGSSCEKSKSSEPLPACSAGNPVVSTPALRNARTRLP